MYKIAEPHLVQCPFDRSHVVSSLRIQKHIVKCQESHPGVKLKSCVYNFSHKVKANEMMEHYEVCPSKTTIGMPHFGNIFFDSSKEILNPKKICNLPTNPKAFTSLWSSNLSWTSSESLDSRLESLGFDTDTTIPSQYSDEDDEDLKPLPLPKTPSKAFMLGNTNNENDKPLLLPKTTSKAFIPVCCSSPSPCSTKSCGRGKNVIMYNTSKSSRKTDHLFPNLSEDEKNSLRKLSKKKSSTCSVSASSLSEKEFISF